MKVLSSTSFIALVILATMMTSSFSLAQNTASGTTTNVCTSSDMTATQCNAHALCWYNNNTKSCNLKPCSQRTYPNCSTSSSDLSCFDYSRKCVTCQVTDATATECPHTSCVRDFSSRSLSCTPPCWKFDSKTCEATDARKKVCALYTQHGGSDSTSATGGANGGQTYTYCIERPQCDGVQDKASCQKRPGGCQWNDKAAACQAPCKKLTDQTTCNANSHCDWEIAADSNTGACVTKPVTKCELAGTYDQCSAALPGCYFNWGTSKCELATCKQRYTKDKCTNDYGKQLGCFYYYQTGYNQCGSCDGTNSSTCEGTRNNGPCKWYNQECVRKCQSYNQHDCKASMSSWCQVDEAGVKKNYSDVCVPLPSGNCENLGTAAKCSASNSCMWDKKNVKCVPACSQWTQSDLCTAQAGCAFNSEWNKCVDASNMTTQHPPATTTTGKPHDTTTAAPNTKITSCSQLTTKQCYNTDAGSDASRLHCFVWNQVCVSCDESAPEGTNNVMAPCNTSFCDRLMTANGYRKCSKKCNLYDRDTCPYNCMVYTPLPNERTWIQCTNRPMCESKYMNQRECDGAYSCEWDSVNQQCKNSCVAWRNGNDCQKMKGCSWDNSTNKCGSPSDVATTTAKPYETTTAAPIATGCARFSYTECTNNATVVKMGCFIYQNKCVSCSVDKNQDLKGQMASCNEDYCDRQIDQASNTVQCARKCKYHSRDSCPTRCQVYTPAPMERTPLQCVERPQCKRSYSTQVACDNDDHCRWNELSASCSDKCMAWKNQKDCEMMRIGTEQTCSWDASTSMCTAHSPSTKPTKPAESTATSRPHFTKPAESTATTRPHFTKPAETTGASPAPTDAPINGCHDIKDARMCHVYSAKWACAFSYSRGVCFSRPCSNRTGDTCTNGDGEKRGCFPLFEKYCSSCNSRECNAKVCSVDADGSCNRRCFTFSDADSCKSAEVGCSWDTTKNKCGDYVAPTPDPNTKPPVKTDCRDFDSATCMKSNMCTWNDEAKVCGYPSCTTYTDVEKCPTDRCRIRASKDAASGQYTKKCTDMCPEKFPVYCESTGVCAESRDRCVSCSSNQVLCWNSKCADSLTQCDCPSNRPIRCESNNGCVATKDECETTNTCSGFSCWDGTCITSKYSVDPSTGKESLNRCPCPSSTPFRCGDGTCSRSEDSCEKQCAEPTPTKCWNGECAVNIASCSCPTEKPIRCKSDNQCAESLESCACPTGTKKCPVVSISDGNTREAAAPRCVRSDASCDVSCPADQPVRCEFGGDEKQACAASSSDCPCPESAWAKAVVVARINAMASSKIEVNAGEKRRVSASAMAYVCRSKREMTARFVWRLVDNADKKMIKLPVSVGSTLEADSSLLTPGHSYTLSVVATLVRRGIALADAPSATASITFTASKPRREVVILGGAERDISSKDESLTVAVDPRRLGGEVDASGKFTNLPKVKWTCKCAEASSTSTCVCPKVLTDALSTADGYKVSVSKIAQNALTAGTYVISASTSDDDCDGTKTDSASSSSTCGASATQTIKIVSDVSPKAQVGIFGVPSTEKLLSSVRGFTLYARTNVPDATLYWSINGQRAGTGKSLSFKPADLQAGKTYIIKVAATAEKTEAYAKASFTVPTKIAGKCEVTVSSDATTDEQKPASGNLESSAPSITSLSTPITISSSWSGIDSSKLKFRFGYFLNRGRVWLSPDASDLSSFSTIAPMISGKTARDVKFVVVATMGDDDKIASATCGATLNPASDDETKEEIKNAFENIQKSGESKDSSRLAGLVSTLSGAAQTTKDKVERKKAQGLAIRAVSTLANTTASSGEDLSRAERSTIIQGIRSTISAEEETDDENTNTDDSSKKSDLKNKLTKMNATMQDLAIRAIFRAVKTPRQGATDKNAMDSENDAKDALGALSNMTIKRKELFKAAVNIARNLAAQTDLGKKIAHKFSNISAFGIQLPGSRKNRMLLNASNSSIAFPEDFEQFSDETSQYSLSATEFKENILGTKGAPSKKKRASVVVDFLVQTNGQEAEVKNSTKPIEILIKLTEDVRQELMKKKKQQKSSSSSDDKNDDDKTTSGAECRYFNEDSQAWSTTGVKTESVSAETGIVKCTTTHLSSYTVFVNSELAANNNDDDGNNNGAADNEANVSGLSSSQRTALIGSVVGGIFLIVALALFIRARRNSSSTGQSGSVYEETNMNHLLFAAPADMDYDDETEMFSNNHQNKNEFSNL